MLKAVTHVSGIHPRSEAHIRTTRRFDRGDATRRELVDVQKKDARDFADLQCKAGISLVSNGLYEWQDAFRKVCMSCDGVDVGTLTRFYDTNTFYRQPTFKSGLRFKRWEETLPKLTKGYEGLALLPGPYTFARMSKDEAYGDLGELMAAVNSVLVKASRWYVSKGINHLLFSEPSLVVTSPKRGEWSSIRDCYKELRKAGARQLIVQTYFGDASKILPGTLDLQVDALGIDFFETELDAIKSFDLGKMRVECGCVDAENSLLERPKDVAAFARMVAKTLDLGSVGIVPNAPMEYLPRAVADEKVKVLAKAASIAGGD